MRNKRQHSLGNLFIGLILATFAVFCMYPMIYVIFASFSDPMKLAQHTGILLSPLDFTLKGYEIIMQYESIWTGYKNTLIIIVVGVTVNIIMTTIGAYVLSRRDVYIHKFLSVMVVITMYFGGGMIPTYMIVKSLGLLDTIWALILPGAISTWNMIILRSAIDGVPSTLIDAARIDGANDLTTLVQVILPLIKPTIAVISLYYMIGHWNSWFSAMIYLQSREKYPLQLILREILITGKNIISSGGFDMTQLDRYKDLTKYCSTVVALVPVLVIYPFLQKYFVKGVFTGAVKE